MTDLTRYEMDTLLLAHEKAELEYDVDATMATLVPNPHFEFPTLGVAIDGWEGVKTMYTHLIARGGRERNLLAYARVIGEAKNTLIREAHISYDNLEGKRVTGLYNVIVEFDPVSKKIVGERQYADKTYTELMLELVGDQYESWPGVSRIVDTAPIINTHDAFEAAAARGIKIDNPANKS